jgi:hypothetical protein
MLRNVAWICSPVEIGNVKAAHSRALEVRQGISRQNCFMLPLKFTPIADDWELSLATGVGASVPMS